MSSVDDEQRAQTVQCGTCGASCEAFGAPGDSAQQPELFGCENLAVPQVTGHAPCCSAECAEARLAEAGSGVVYALDLLAALANDDRLIHGDPSHVAHWTARCEATLRAAIGDLLREPRSASRGDGDHFQSARARFDRETLQRLCGAPGSAVVEVRCVACAADSPPHDRYVERFGLSGDREEAGLCAWHAHLEALMRTRRRAARRVEPNAQGASRAGAPSARRSA